MKKLNAPKLFGVTDQCLMKSGLSDINAVTNYTTELAAAITGAELYASHA